MNSPQLQQQYPFSYGPMQPVELVYTQAQQNMQRMPQQCGNMNCIFPIQQPVHPQPQQFNPYLMQCSYLLPPPFCGHGQRSIYHYPQQQQQQLQPPPLYFFNQAHYAQPPHGLAPHPAPTQQMPPLPQQMRPIPVQAQQLNSFCHAQLQSIYRAHATFETPPVMPQTPANFNFLPNPLEGSPCANTTGYPGDEEHRKHVFLRGALYNADFLKSPIQQDSTDSPTFKDGKLQANVTDDDPYDPMDEALPTIYGIRFYNPNFGPEGAIPKKSYVRKQIDTMQSHVVPFTKPPDSFAHGLPQFRGIYPLLPLHRMANAESYGYQPIGVSQDALPVVDYSTGELDYNIPGNMSPKCLGMSMSPNSKAKQQRRQGRNRMRGFTQSFGIVAPVKRNNQSAKENMVAAKNVLSLFDTKPPMKKWLTDEWTISNTGMGEQADTECNGVSQAIRSLERDLSK